ncbi:hypothetical protein EDD93_0979 [Streptomyces sp. 840.1]|uniref:hypothetical protein n=1 Tax=Streptomyces sp. 840.1 TaxID=2485152 RepID=UPI000F47796D|nr:hypothetical protein [Streptomyces sp. 840.1]ROQ66571.1 hypothetical protein EDD93_0979 [Streptomyces sp. 840.1]
MVPEVQEQAEAASDLDLYDFLKDVFTDGLLVPLLHSAQTHDAADGALARCFRFVEILLTSPDASIRSAAAFQVIEPLFDDERLLVASFPAMGEEALAVAADTLDLDRISSDARSVLRPYLSCPGS